MHVGVPEGQSAPVEHPQTPPERHFNPVGCPVQSLLFLHAQVPPLPHTVLVQSVGPRHILPYAHAGQAPPPQSTSVSVPSGRPSPHELAWQTMGEP